MSNFKNISWFFLSFSQSCKEPLSKRNTSPLLLKPKISKLMLEVRPVWISCRCLKRFSRARPRPLSNSPCVRTPSRVDFPESTFPSTATRRSRNWGMKIDLAQPLQEIQNYNMFTGTMLQRTHLLIVRDLSDKNLCNFPDISVQAIVHFPFSQKRYISSDPSTRQAKQSIISEIITHC